MAGKEAVKRLFVFQGVDGRVGGRDVLGVEVEVLNGVC